MLLLPKRLVDLRESRDLTKSAVARVLNMSLQGYISYETEKNTPPLETIIKLAEFYNVSVDYIVGFEPEDNEFNHLVKEMRSLSSSQRKKVAEYINLLKTHEAYQKYQAKELAIQERKNKRTAYNTNYVREQRQKQKQAATSPPVDEDTNPVEDPFYSEINMNHLIKIISDIETGKSKLIEHEPSED